MAIRVILVDDHPIIRTGIKNLINAGDDITVIGEAQTGMEAIEAVKVKKPDVLILDMELPDINGIEVARRIKNSGSSVRILAFSGHDDREYIRGVLHEGAVGYLTKDEGSEGIVDAIRGVAAGENGWISRRAKAVLMSMVSDNDEPQGMKITPREKQVCKLVTEGRTNNRIAYEMNISQKTVEKYLYNLFQKYDVASRVELAVLLVREKVKFH